MKLELLTTKLEIRGTRLSTSIFPYAPWRNLHLGLSVMGFAQNTLYRAVTWERGHTRRTVKWPLRMRPSGWCTFSLNVVESFREYKLNHSVLKIYPLIVTVWSHLMTGMWASDFRAMEPNLHWFSLTCLVNDLSCFSVRLFNAWCAHPTRFMVTEQWKRYHYHVAPSMNKNTGRPPHVTEFVFNCILRLLTYCRLSILSFLSVPYWSTCSRFLRTKFIAFEFLSLSGEHTDLLMNFKRASCYGVPTVIRYCDF
jgi:hypothetical protein